MNRRCRFSSLGALAASIAVALGPARPSQGAGLAAVPEHVQTSIQDLCYTDTCWHRSQKAVPLRNVAAQATWAFADASIAADARRAGIRTIAYLDPSIQYDPKRDVAPLASDDESTYLRACDGSRARVRLGDLDGYLMNEAAPAFRARLARYVDEHVRPVAIAVDGRRTPGGRVMPLGAPDLPAVRRRRVEQREERFLLSLLHVGEHDHLVVE